MQWSFLFDVVWLVRFVSLPVLNELQRVPNVFQIETRTKWSENTLDNVPNVLASSFGSVSFDQPFYLFGADKRDERARKGTHHDHSRAVLLHCVMVLRWSDGRVISGCIRLLRRFRTRWKTCVTGSLIYWFLDRPLGCCVDHIPHIDGFDDVSKRNVGEVANTTRLLFRRSIYFLFEEHPCIR